MDHSDYGMVVSSRVDADLSLKFSKPPNSGALSTSYPQTYYDLQPKHPSAIKPSENLAHPFKNYAGELEVHNSCSDLRKFRIEYSNNLSNDHSNSLIPLSPNYVPVSIPVPNGCPSFPATSEPKDTRHPAETVDEKSPSSPRAPTSLHPQYGMERVGPLECSLTGVPAPLTGGTIDLKREDRGMRNIPTSTNMSSGFLINSIDKRKKNNEAAKRSRDARRLKENTTFFAVNFYEIENTRLKERIYHKRRILEDLVYEIQQKRIRTD